MKTLLRRVLLPALMTLTVLALARADGNYEIYVSNEKSGDLTVIDGARLEAVATIPVGKRPRGIHASPDGRAVYVALSGTPISAPPKLDAQGNPIFQKGKDDDDDEALADKKADGIGVVDVAQRKFVRKIPAGSDPEQFAVSADGTHLYISNEDVSAASVLRIADEKIEHLVPVGARAGRGRRHAGWESVLCHVRDRRPRLRD